MKLLEVSDNVYQFYRTNVKGNENITLDQLQRKLTRNMLLAMEVPPRNEIERNKGNRMYIYGNLHFVVRNDKVVHIHNHTGGGKFYGGWEPNEKRYIELNKELEIAE